MSLYPKMFGGFGAGKRVNGWQMMIQKSREQKDMKVARVSARPKSDDFDELSPTFLSLGIRDEGSANQFLSRLYPNERKLLYDLIQRRRAAQYISVQQLEKQKATEVHHDELVNIWWISYTPFFCYGLMDNTSMIVAGESFDMTMGQAMGVSVMGGAAAGNIVSNLIALVLLQKVEQGVAKMLSQPSLLPGQQGLWSVKFVQNLGRVCGILSGCILGMFPLLFYANERHEEMTFSDVQSLEKREDELGHDWLTITSHTLNRQLFDDYKLYEEGIVVPQVTADESSVLGLGRVSGDRSRPGEDIQHSAGDRGDDEPLPTNPMEY